uniref:Uncharacterized protein n=1 Tax=Anguilla anguilla TaxID=7936 RepID=A0A0E9UG69_ANGAN
MSLFVSHYIHKPLLSGFFSQPLLIESWTMRKVLLWSQ